MCIVFAVSALLSSENTVRELEFLFMRARLPILVFLESYIHHYVVIASGDVASFLRCHSFPSLHIRWTAFSAYFLLWVSYLFRSLPGRSYVVGIPALLDRLGTFLRVGYEVWPLLEMRSACHVRCIRFSTVDAYRLSMPMCLPVLRRYVLPMGEEIYCI